MKQKFGKRFIQIPIGLFVLSGTIAITNFNNLPDGITGILYGIGIGLIGLPFVLKKIRPINC